MSRPLRCEQCGEDIQLNLVKSDAVPPPRPLTLSLVAQAEAAEHGCQQVLFLDSVEGRYLEELGGMNIVLVKRDGTLVTPQSASILPGITRDSVLHLAEDRGHTVERRQVSIDEWREGVAQK